MNKEEKVILKFKGSIDYRDICYFIDHVPNIAFRESLIQELGYTLGLNITSDETLKTMIVGKRGEIRMVISPPKFKMARCVVIEKKDLKNLKNIH